MGEIIMDVRERDEFEAEHVEHSINVPLSHFAVVAPGVLNQLRERDVLILCRSGNRARLAAEQVRQMGYSDKVTARVLEGGIVEWKRQGKPTVQRQKRHLPLMRQVQLVAGSAVLTSTLLGAFLNPWFLALAAFFGAGLIFAGATGFCGLAMLLDRMPWNRKQGESA
jgi:rhodanese-related sulfurtransferase